MVAPIPDISGRRKNRICPYVCSWGVSSPIWSPDGEFIVFYQSVSYGDGWRRYIAVIRPDGSGYRRIHELSAPPGLFHDPGELFTRWDPSRFRPVPVA